MSKIALLLYIMAAPTLAGILVVAVLTMPGWTLPMLLAAVAVGFVAAIPVAWLVAKQVA